MSDKVKLPKKIAEALETVRVNGFTNQEIIEGATGRSLDDSMLYLSGFVSQRGFDDLLKALVNGYEVEHTMEERLLESFKRGLIINDKSLQERLNGVYQLGFQNALTIAGIQIEGINT